MAETTGSATGRSRMVTGLFRDRESAERAYGSVTKCRMYYGYNYFRHPELHFICLGRYGQYKQL